MKFEICPICGSEGEQEDKCPRNCYACKNDHHWHYCHTCEEIHNIRANHNIPIQFCSAQKSFKFITSREIMFIYGTIKITQFEYFKIRDIIERFIRNNYFKFYFVTGDNDGVCKAVIDAFNRLDLNRALSVVSVGAARNFNKENRLFQYCGEGDQFFERVESRNKVLIEKADNIWLFLNFTDLKPYETYLFETVTRLRKANSVVNIKELYKDVDKFKQD